MPGTVNLRRRKSTYVLIFELATNSNLEPLPRLIRRGKASIQAIAITISSNGYVSSANEKAKFRNDRIGDHSPSGSRSRLVLRFVFRDQESFSLARAAHALSARPDRPEPRGVVFLL